MQVEISNENAQMVEGYLRSGQYKSADEVVNAAFDLLRAQRDEEMARQDTLRSAIECAMDERSDRLASPLDPEQVIADQRSQPRRLDGPRVDSRVLATPSAESDLKRIWKIFSKDTLDAADVQVRRLADRCRRVATMPGMGRARQELSPGVQSVTAHGFMIYYIMDGLTLVVLRVLPTGE